MQHFDHFHSYEQKQLEFLSFKHHIGGGQQQKFCTKSSKLRLLPQSIKYFEGSNAVKTTSMRNQTTTPLFCCTSEGRNRSTKKSTTSHRGWPTAKNVRNPLNSRKLFLAASCTFLGSIYSFLLMSNKNLSFLLFKHYIGTKNMGCFLNAHGCCLNCIGSLKVLNNVTL